MWYNYIRNLMLYIGILLLFVASFLASMETIGEDKYAEKV